MRKALFFVLALAFTSPALAQTAKLVAVPFVGCAADGQVGPQAAPKSGPRPALPAPLAAKLAYYKGPYDMGILAPRGWHCWQVYGSNGSTLMVTPERGSNNLFDVLKLQSPAVTLTSSLGSTSGRFAVASIAGSLFPIAEDFVKSVKEEPQTDLQFATFPDDTLHRLSDTVVEFTTPPHTTGLGTLGRLLPSDLPIDGVAILLPNEDMDLVMIRVRLAPNMRDLTPVIIKQKTETIEQCECSSDK